MIGKTISHYEIMEKLGEGGMGVVYRAHDTKLERSIALKFLPPHLGNDESEKQRFIHEARAASALEHTNICNIHSIEETEEGQLFIVMAHYEGMSLKDKIRQGPLPLKDIVSYSIQIAEGLKKAHQHDIVHRDLKPANIFVTNDEQIKIIDFGLAKAAARTMLTKTGTTLGTAPYMSPEQAQGDTMDNRTDIWSFGVVMYEMITGQLPFRSEYETALVYSILNENPEPVTGLRSGVPMELERIVQKCLEKNQSERYQNTGDILVDLRKVEREITTGERSKSVVSGLKEDKKPAVDIPRTKRSNTWMLSIPVIVLLLIGIYFLFPDKQAMTDISRSIAVLPLENLSPDPDDAIFAAGMHEDIIIQLSRIGDIHVIARSSVMGYPAGQRNIQRISNDLGVHSILEGSVRRAGGRVRVAVTLIDVRSNRTLWADTFDRDLTDIFTIQSEIAFEIAHALEARLTDREKQQLDERPTTVSEAYEYYLRAREYYTLPAIQEDYYINAEAFLKKAIEYDPEFAHAYALLSRTYSFMRWFGYDTSPETRAAALHNAERAFEIQPDLPEAHIAMGYYYYYGYREYDKALEHFYRALHFQPNNVEIIASIGFVERRLGRFEDSIRNLTKAISLDPRNLNLLFNNAQSYTITGKYEEANQLYEKALAIAPEFSVIKIFLSLNNILWTGDVEWNRTFLDDNLDIKDDYPGDWLRLQFIIGGFQEMIQTVDDIPDDMYRGQLYLYSPSFIRGIAYDHLGDRENAHRYYRDAISEYNEISSTYNNDIRYILSLGRIYAGLDLAEEANEQIEIANTMLSELDDAMSSSAYKTEIAGIYAKLQSPEEATEILREILSTSGFQSIERMKIDPVWDPIRDTYEFQQLMREFESSV